MLTWLARIDALVAHTRPVWRWVGQLALVALGVHLAADHLDDLLATALTSLPVSWPDPETPTRTATWGALGAELFVVCWSAWALARTVGEPVDSVRAWSRRLSVHAVVAPLAWLPLALAGCWSIAMATEDAVAEWWLDAASPVAWAVAVVVGWRLGATGLVSLVRCTPEPRRRSEGWIWALVVVPMAVLAWRFGVPVWSALGGVP